MIHMALRVFRPPPGSDDKHCHRTKVHSEQTKKVVRAMKSFLFPILLFAILAVGCAHSPSPTSSLAPSAASFQSQQVTVTSKSEQITLKSPEMLVKSESESVDDKEDLDDVEDEFEEEAKLADSPESLKSSPEMSVKSGNESADNEENPADEEKVGEVFVFHEALESRDDFLSVNHLIESFRSVFFRPHADAHYDSTHIPWTRSLRLLEAGVFL